MILRIFRAVLCMLAALGLTATAHAETWHRADTHHFVVYSNGGAKQLDDFAHKLERFDSLLRMLFRRQPEVQPNRLTVYMIDNARAVDRLLGPKRSNTAGFYIADVKGSYAVANRERGSGRFSLDGQTVLFHEYAHHFMFRNFPVPTPAWFVEGFAEYVSTADFERDGSWTYGELAYHRAYSLKGEPQTPIRELLTGDARREDTYGFYAWSWALTHMLYRGNDRGARIGQYLNRLMEGETSLEAAEAVFGDLDELEKSLKRYVDGRMVYQKSDSPLPYQSDISVRRLGDYESELVELTLERMHDHKVEKLRSKFDRLLAGPEADAEGYYQLAEFEHRAAHLEDAPQQYDFSAAHAAVDQALVLDPDHVLANVLKGDLLLEPFDHDEDPDPANWEASRKYFVRANRADPLHPLPLYRFASTYLRSGTANDQVGDALNEAFLGAPEARELRFALATYEANEGNYDQAIGLLKVIAGNPHSGEGARKFIAQLEAAKRGDPLALEPIDIETDETGGEAR